MTRRTRACRFGAACTALLAAAAGAQTGPYAPTVPGAGGSISSTPSAATAREAFGTTGDTRPSPWTASIGIQETLTNNVNLSGNVVNPSEGKRGALVTEITPSLGLQYVGPRATLRGTASLPIVIYTPSDAASDRVYPAVDLVGDLVIVKDFLFLEGAVNLTQQFFNPFGAQPIGLTNTSGNRYRTDVYRISPFIRSTTSNGTSYELRNDNVWTNLNGAPIDTSSSRYTTFFGNATNTQTTVGWRASFDYTDVQFNDNNQPSTVTQLYRGTGIYKATPSLRLTASAGWESNDFQFTSSSDVIYGVGFVWRPTELTNVSGDWEERYFGASYNFLAEHTTPLSQWRLSAYRNVTTYPQQIASLPGGVNVTSFLNALFQPSVTDPSQRAQLIEQLIRDRGLPTTLNGPVSLYTNQTLLQQGYSAAAGLVGARNSVFFTAYYVKNEPITATGVVLPPALSLGNDNTQTGGTVVWTHILTPQVNFVSSLELLKTVDNGGAGGAFSGAETKQGAVRLGISTPLTPQTTLYAGARYQFLQSNVAQDYTEAAGFVGLTYTFR